MWPFRRKPAADAAPARVHAPEIQGKRDIDKGLRSASALRRRPTTTHPHAEQPPARGMWVRYQDRTGILIDLEPGDVATVMLVDDEGSNVLEVHVPAAQLRQAYHEEIPEKRRPDLERALAHGYTRGAT